MAHETKNKQPVKTHEEIPSSHWADQAAEELIQKHPQTAEFTCASGISPSGVVHIGNFREVITVDFVVRALQDRGKKVRFIYSWDDYDAFRKVPANLPNKEALEKELRKPLALISDPFNEQKSYALQFEKRFEKEISQLGISPTFIYQNEQYRKCAYAKGVATALANEGTIRKILNAARTEDLPDNWTCVSVFCRKCLRDTTDVVKYHEPSKVEYRCKVCHKGTAETDTMDFTVDGGVKLLWRVDWPMRWAHEKVDFEPGGKDHSSQGGSYDTGAEIVKQVWKREPPFYVQYDFVVAKGAGAKLSSSSGNLITLGEALEVYEPEVVRWIFASRKPNLDFAIAFDLDVMKAYDEFDRNERFAYGLETGEEKKVTYEKRIYELSIVNRVSDFSASKMPAQFPFRHLCNILQIHQGSIEKAITHFAGEIKTDQDRLRFESRAQRAWKWINEYAPADFKFQLRSKSDEVPKTTATKPIQELIELIATPGKLQLADDELANEIFQLMKRNSLEAKVFFQEVYWILIGKKAGPKLASFLKAIGPEVANDILKRSL